MSSLAGPVMGTIFLSVIGLVSVYFWAREASPTLGCSIEISRDWESEASPTLGCSIEISGDVGMLYVVCPMSVLCQINCVGQITWPKRMLKSFGGRLNQ